MLRHFFYDDASSEKAVKHFSKKEQDHQKNVAPPALFSIYLCHGFYKTMRYDVCQGKVESGFPDQANKKGIESLAGST